jgi:hypothetical protein
MENLIRISLSAIELESCNTFTRGNLDHGAQILFRRVP